MADSPSTPGLDDFLSLLRVELADETAMHSTGLTGESRLRSDLGLDSLAFLRVVMLVDSLNVVPVSDQALEALSEDPSVEELWFTLRSK